MAVSPDDSPKFQQYAHPERLVSTDWLAAGSRTARSARRRHGRRGVRRGRAALRHRPHPRRGQGRLAHRPERPGDPRLRRRRSASPRCWAQRGIGRDTTVVFYGDKNNWWAAYALWVFSLFGHEDVRLLDGGRAKWVAEGRELTRTCPTPTPVDYPVVERDDTRIRAFKDDVLAHLGQPLVDVRSPGEYSGELLHMPDYPQEGAMRGGHIPGAQVVPWARAAAEDGTFKSRAGPRGDLPRRAGPRRPDDDVVAYCRIGERSSHTWFVLTHLLGFDQVRNYDGSWTEWGNAVRVPIER